MIFHVCHLDHGLVFDGIGLCSCKHSGSLVPLCHLYVMVLFPSCRALAANLHVCVCVMDQAFTLGSSIPGFLLSGHVS